MSTNPLPNVQDLALFLHNLRAGNTNVIIKVQIIGYFRHIPDYTSPNDLKDCSVLYDVVVRAEGSDILKCTLHPKLNNMLEKGFIKIGSIVKIAKSRMLSPSDAFVVIDSFIKVLDYEKPPESDSMHFLLRSPQHSDALPLFSKRSCYIDPWVTDVPYGRGFFVKNPSIYSQVEMLDYPPITLRELEMEAQKVITPYPPLILTVLARGKLHHYGKSGDLRCFPFQGYFLLGDHTGICRAVMWDDANIKFFGRMVPGCFILVRRYRTKVQNQGLEWIALHVDGRCTGIPYQKQELQLNPSTIIVVLNKQEARKYCSEIGNYPIMKYILVNRLLLSDIPSGKVVDVLGLVTYVGHFLRERDPKKPDNFVVHRWIEMIDDSCNQSFQIQLYVHYPVEDHKAIAPGDALILTHLCVTEVDERQATSEHRKPTGICLTSTFYTRIVRDLSSVKNTDTIRWIEKHRDYLSFLYRIGGFVSCTYAVKSNPEILLPQNQQTVEFLTGSQLCKAIQNLVLREHKHVNLKGFITSFILLKVSGVTVSKELIYNDFVNLKLSSLASDNWTLVFPQRYSNFCKESLLYWINLPPFHISEHRLEPVREEQRKEMPFLRTDGYYLTILSEDGDVQVGVFFFSKPSEQPYPSLKQLLERQYQPKVSMPSYQDKDVYEGRYMYSSSEVEHLKNHSEDIHRQQFNFEIDLFCYDKENVVAFLRNASADTMMVIE